MIVNAKFKREILAGHAPALTDTEVHPGQVVEIERNYVWIVVLRRRKEGTWAYTIRDDRPRLLGKATGETRISSRAIGSGTNTQPGNLWTEPERIEKAPEDDYATAAEAPSKEQRRRRRINPQGLTAAELQASRRSLEARLGLARKVAEIRQVDISPDLRGIEKRLERIERQLAAAEEAA